LPRFRDPSCENIKTRYSQVKYKDAICKGEQEAIIDRNIWNRVKEIQKNTNPQADHSRRQETIAPLKSVLRCGHCGGAMMPIYSNKGGRRYYYYLCCKDSKRAVSECPVKQIPAGDIEELVRHQLQKMLSDITLIMRFAEKSGMNPIEVTECFQEELFCLPLNLNFAFLFFCGSLSSSYQERGENKNAQDPVFSQRKGQSSHPPSSGSGSHFHDLFGYGHPSQHFLSLAETVSF
jgi:hypothetical protein